MKSREATWEKRNLGVTAYEFFIDINETPEEVMPEICACKAEYQTLHIASGNTGVLLEAQEEGFQVIEMGFEMELPINNLHFPKIYERFEPYLSYAIANNEEINDIINVVQSGEIFTTDKVARDPFFGPQKSGVRYSYWINDVIQDGATTILVKYKGDIVGFHILLTDERGTVKGVLGGIFPSYENKGLGFAIIYAALKWAKDIGGKRMITNVSSNNLPIIKLYEIFGFTMKSADYILVKHLR